MKYIIGAIIGVIIAYLIGWGIYCGLWLLICKCFDWNFVLGRATGTYVIACIAVVLLRRIFGGSK